MSTAVDGASRVTSRSGLRALVALVAATMSWGASTVVNKLTLDETRMRPLTIMIIQLMCSIAVLTIITMIRRPPHVRKLWRSGWVGLLEPGAAYVIGLIGLSMTSAVHASIIGALEPILVVVTAWLFLRETISIRVALLIAVVLAGGITVVLAEQNSGDRATIHGDLLLVLAVLGAAMYVMISSRRHDSAPPLATTLTQQVWALAIVIPAAFIGAMTVGAGPMPHGRDWYLIATSGLLSYLVPFTLYTYAVTSLPPQLTAQLLALIPLCGMLAAAMILHEPIGTQSAIGGALVIGALLLLARQSS